VKEGERKPFSHYIFANPVPWKLLRSEKSCTGRHYGMQWEDGMYIENIIQSSKLIFRCK